MNKTEVKALEIQHKPVKGRGRTKMMVAERAESIQLQRIRTLNQIGMKIQEELNYDNILNLIGEGLKELGFNYVFMSLDEEQNNMRIEQTSIAASQLAKVEKLVHLKAIGFEIPVEIDESFSVVVREKRAIFTSRLVDSLKATFPSLLTPVLSRIAGILGFGESRGIAAPLVARDKVIGVLNVWSSNISEEDIPTVLAFANQAAIAIYNARLLSESNAKAKELEESENNYKLLLESVSDGYAVIQEGKFIFANGRFGDIFGYKLEQLIGMPIDQLMVPDYRQAAIEQHERVARGEVEAIVIWEAMGLKANGTKIIVEATIRPIQYDNKPAASVIIRDTTKRRRTEEKYKQLLEDIHDGYAVMQDGEYVFANRRFHEIFGCEPWELIYETFTELDLSDSNQPLTKEFDNLMRSEEVPTMRYEVVGIRPDGTRVIAETSMKAIEYEGKPAQSILSRDITERKRIEEALRDSEQHHRVLIEMASHLGEGIIIANDFEGRRGTVAFANDAVTKVLGYSNEELCQMTLLDLVAPASLKEVEERYLQRQAGDRTDEHYESIVLAKNGTEIPIQIEVGNTTYQGKPAIVAFIRNITERKQAEEALRNSEQHHRVLIEMANRLGEGIILAWDFEGMRGVIAFVNDAVTKIMGYSREELLQVKMRDFASSASEQDIAQRYLHRQAGDKTEEHYESTMLTKDGTEIQLEIQTGNTVYQGKPAIVAFIRDITQRKLMESQLRNYSERLERMVEDRTRELRIAEASYQAIFEYAGDAIIVTDNNDVVRLWNKEAEQMFGYEEDEIVGEKWHMIVPEELRGEIVWLVDETRQKGHIKDYITERVRKDGKKLAVELTSTVLRDTQENPVGLSTIIRDITVRKLMEEQRRRLEEEKEKTRAELARSEERYRSVFEHSGLAVGIFNNEGAAQLLNKEAERMFGYTVEELNHKRASSLLVPDDLYEDAKWLNKEVKDKGYIDSYETERIRKDGTRFPVEMSIASLKDEGGNLIGGSFIAKDITERKKLEQEREKARVELARSEERYRSIFEHSGMAMGVFGQDGTVYLVNKEAERMFGYTAEELTASPALMIVVPDDLSGEIEWLMKEMFEKGYVDSFETERIRKDGTRFPVEVTVASLNDEEGKMIGATFICKDITERKILEQEREEAQQQLMTSERLSAIGQLASIVGHELRNPLAVISNSVYYLKMKLGDSDEKVNKHLGILEGEVAISSRIISNILDFARPKQPVFQDININSVIEQALEKYTLPDDVKVFTEIGTSLPQITADAEQLRQVFVNMISNAAQAMPEGGELLISTTLNDDLIKVEFKDTGVGISPENLEKILQPMFSTKVKGVGLGLTISKKIIENHGGKLEVTSQVDQGTTFIITLPVGGKDER